MKATLEFDFSTDGDKMEFERCVKATDIYLALWKFEDFMRQKRKYEDLTEDQFTLLEELRDFYYSVLSDYNISVENELE